MSPTLDADLTVTEASARFKVSANTIRRWIASGRLQAYRVGPRLLRVRTADLEQLVHPARPGSAA